MILEWKAVFARRETPNRVVVTVVEICHLKMEVRIARRDRLLAPVDSTAHDVDSLVAAPQPAGEPDCDPAHPAADVEDILVGAKTAQIREELPKLHSGGAKVTAPDKAKTVRRRQRIARTAECRVAGVEGHSARKRRRAHEADVLQFAAQLPRYRCRRTRLPRTDTSWSGLATESAARASARNCRIRTHRGRTRVSA